MKIIAPWGYCVISRDPMEDSIEYPGGIKIYIPDERRKLASTGTVLLHSSTMEESFTGKRVIFDKYVGRSWRMRDTEFWTVHERAIMAVFEEETER